MIFTDRKITIRNGKSSIDAPVVLYRGDFEVSIKFTIMESKFRFKSGVNLVDSEKASFGQLAILAPYGGNVFSEIVKCEDGTVTFTLTKEMIDQLEEVGLYSFQIRLFDYYRESRVSIPPVEFGIEVREPVASEDHDNEVNNAIVGYSIAKVVDGLNEDVPDTFDEDGQYNKTNWETGDRISEGKLNKIEDAIDKINRNEINDKNALNKQMTSNFNVLDSNKADKNEIFSMANMGQDIKEAMTGGSVAVVGKNAVLTENIANAQITNNKLAYRYLDGVIKQGFINIDTTNKKLYASGPAGVYIDVINKYVLYNEHEVDLSDISFGGILVIYFNITTKQYQVIPYDRTIEHPESLAFIATLWQNKANGIQDESAIRINNILATAISPERNVTSNYHCALVNGLIKIDTVSRQITYEAFNVVASIGFHSVIPKGTHIYDDMGDMCLNIYVDTKDKKIVSYQHHDRAQDSTIGLLFIGTLYKNKIYNTINLDNIIVDDVKKGGWDVIYMDYTTEVTSNYRCGLVNGYIQINTLTGTVTWRAFNVMVPLGLHRSHDVIKEGEASYDITNSAVNMYADVINNTITFYEYSDTAQNSLTGQFFIGTIYNGKLHNALNTNFISVNGVENGGWYVEPQGSSNANERIMTLNEVWNNWERGLKCPIAFLGDSTTDGNTTTGNTGNTPGTDHIDPNAYPYLLEQLIKTETNNTNVRIYNAGFSGETAPWARDNIQRILEPYSDVKMIGISYGINDSITDDIGTYYDTFKDNVEWLILYFKNNGIQPFLLTTQAVLMKKGGKKQTTADKISTVANEIKKELANKYNLELIDVNKFTENFLLYSKYNINEIEPDSLHFGDIGHKYESELFFSILCPRVINTSEVDTISLITQNVKTDITSFDRNLNSEFKYITDYDRQDTSELLVLDVLLFNDEKKQIKMSVTGDVIIKDNDVVISNISEYEMDLGLHRIQVMTQQSHVYFEGIKLIR